MSYRKIRWMYNVDVLCMKVKKERNTILCDDSTCRCSTARRCESFTRETGVTGKSFQGKIIEDTSTG
jgi:hypothetical protein